MLRQAVVRDVRSGVRRGDMAVLCHTNRELETMTAEPRRLDVPLTALLGWTGEPDDNVKIGTIHRSKGLDFAAVYLPDLQRPRAGHDVDPDRALQRAQREFVGRTRPRDRLWIGRLHDSRT